MWARVRKLQFKLTHPQHSVHIHASMRMHACVGGTHLYLHHALPNLDFPGLEVHADGGHVCRGVHILHIPEQEARFPHTCAHNREKKQVQFYLQKCVDWLSRGQGEECRATAGAWGGWHLNKHDSTEKGLGGTAVVPRRASIGSTATRTQRV